MPELIFVIVASFLGVLAATLIPYKRKKSEGKIESFDLKYIKHLVITTLWTFMVDIVIYLEWSPPVGITSEIGILILAFGFGYGGNGFQRDLEKVIHRFESLFSS